MDKKQHEGEQTAIASSHQYILPVGDKSCSESSTPIKKQHINEIALFDAKFVSPTPEKTEETLTIRCKKEPARLPEKYGFLSELFDRMTTSLRLLNLRKQLPTFHNICRQVETLTGRKFSYKNLAQIKFILPEAVQTDKILLHNKTTLSMEPEIKVTLCFDVVEGHNEHSDYLALCSIFSSRLLKFVMTHSEDCDVPEAELPEPFNRKEIKISPNSLPVGKPIKSLPNLVESELLNLSHFSPSFHQHFSKKDVENSTKTELPQSPVSSSSVKETTCSSCLNQVKHEKVLEVDYGDTPMKKPLITDEITIETPDLSTPKRSVPTEDNKLKSMVNQKATPSSAFAKRSLDFSNVDDEEGVFFEEKTTSARGSSAKVEDESCHLSDIVETILNIFKSANCCSITKSELVHKILVNNLDITESGEVEEQIERLVEKVPEWIAKKVDPNGDFLYNINKGFDLTFITEKLM